MSAPWMPLYVADYIADTGHLSAAEHGAYLMLIMHYWRAGSLPKDERALARIARMTEREWKNSRDTIAAFFDENWTHNRIEIELKKAAMKSERRSESGSRGGKAKALKDNNASLANATSLLKQNDDKGDEIAIASSSLSLSDKEKYMSETSSDVQVTLPVEKKKRTKQAYSDSFLAFWSAYPVDPLMSKKDASAAWLRLDEADQELAMAGLPALIDHQKKNPTYRMVHACRYLSQRRFETLAPSARGSPDVASQFQNPEDWFANLRARNSVEKVTNGPD